MATAADIQQVQQDLIGLKGMVEQLGFQMQLTKVDLRNITATNINQMKNFEKQTVKEVIKMKEDINVAYVNATQELEAQK